MAYNNTKKRKDIYMKNKTFFKIFIMIILLIVSFFGFTILATKTLSSERRYISYPSENDFQD